MLLSLIELPLARKAAGSDGSSCLKGGVSASYYELVSKLIKLFFPRGMLVELPSGFFQREIDVSRSC